MHKTNDLVEIYEEWQEDKGLIGVAILKAKIRDGLPFIPNFAEEGFRNPTTVHKVVTYNYERWNVAFLTLTELGKKIVYQKAFPAFNIRFPYYQGVSRI